MSVFKEITDPEKLAKQKDLSHLFIGLDIVDDVSRGLRGFPRTIDRLTNQMVVLYKKMYPQQAEETLRAIEDRLEIERIQKQKAAREEARRDAEREMQQ